MGNADIGEIEVFHTLREVAQGVSNVKTVVPMGLNIATVYTGNELDRVLEDLRNSVDAGGGAQSAVYAGQIRQMLTEMIGEYEARLSVISDQATTKDDLATLTRAASDEFWTPFDEKPYPVIDYLEANVAKLASEGQLIYLRYLGTDLSLFKDSFSTFELVDGELVPPNARGLMLSKHFYEERVKNRVARLLDNIHEGITKRGLTISGDGELGLKARQLPGQYGRITLQLKPDGAKALDEGLGKLMPEVEGELKDRVQAFLKVDDSNFAERYAFFYEEIAPRIRLYKVNVGDTLALRAYTRGGYARAANVKVYGTFGFAGLEDSDLAGAANLIDLVTFRELYGHMSDIQRAELSSIRAGVKAERADRETAEADLFGGDSDLEEEDDGGGFDEFEGVEIQGIKAQRAKVMSTFTQDEIDSGLALNAAIILEDPSKIEETQAQLEAALTAAGMQMKVVDWQKASGIVGEYITVVRLVLYIAIFIIFLVALVILNNSMVMATIDRTPEIGTMRAIGMHRSRVGTVFLLEALILGLVATSIGALIGAGIAMGVDAAAIEVKVRAVQAILLSDKIRLVVEPAHVLRSIGTFTRAMFFTHTFWGSRPHVA